MAIYLPTLDYDFNALEPFISEKTMQVHYNKHLFTYINNTNTLIQNTDFVNKNILEMVQTAVGTIYNNAAQAYNHIFFFKCLRPKSENSSNLPLQLLDAINKYFDSMENFKAQFIESAVKNFGSGWTWLIQDKITQKLSIINTSNAFNPITDDYKILLCIDVWEHAYYLDYQSDRKSYVTNFFDYINWDFVYQNFSKE